MATGTMEECRSLLNKENNLNFFQRIRRNYWNFPSEKILALGALICLFVSVTLLLTVQIYANRKDIYMGKSLLTEEDELYSFSSNEEKALFQLEWKKGKNLLAQNKNIQENSAVTSQNSSSTDNFQELFSRNQKVPELLTECAYILEHMKRVFKRCINQDVLPEECKRALHMPFHCNPRNPYRSVNGSCNNLANPSWGTSGVTFLRWLKPDYADDVSLPRMSVYGVQLPNARLLTSKLFAQKAKPDAQTTMMFVNFGLFLDHDIVRSDVTRIDRKCCSAEVLENPNQRHPQCFEIEIPKWDAFYSPLNVTCMNFYRGSPGVGKCPGRRDQMNVMTSYIDASDIYGTSDEELNKIRSFKEGKLRTRLIGNTPLLPVNENSGDTCYTKEIPYKCFQSGDIRTNMHLELMTFHTIWFREHNRLTDELRRYNPHWSDEKLFQEARRIVIAELQLITYREFLPRIFGQEKLREYGLEINENQTYDGYDEMVNAGLHNGFATGAFRLGHSWIQDVIELRGPKYKLRSVIPFHQTFMNPSVLYNLGYDDILRGMAAQRVHHTDSYVTEEVRNRLLQKYNQDHGIDLTAISIQRGRDHGLPGYTKWRQFCGLPNITSWEDMLGVMDKERVEALRALYMSVDDVDLIPAGLAEHHVKGSYAGPTYICMLGKQFHALRHGDRFWFENSNLPGSFTKAQLKELYKSSMTRVLCDTSDAVQTMQKYPFQLPSDYNPILKCKEVPSMDLSLWTE